MTPAWTPTPDILNSANISQWMRACNTTDVPSFHQWTVIHYLEFWQKVIQQLGIIFQEKPAQVCDLSQGVASPQWLPGAKLNIVESCFNAPATAPALFFQDQQQNLQSLNYGELKNLVNHYAQYLIAQGLKAGDAIAIIMPMTAQAIAIYLGIIKMGGIVVSIADSFSSEEINTRLRIANAKAIFTQDFSIRDGKKIPLGEKIKKSTQHLAIHTVINADILPTATATDFAAVPCAPTAVCNILFSSGTTAAPKAIPWTHTTPIKCASDAYFHHNIQAGDRLCWPTNLGWMMGPWLIFASFMNQAAIVLYTDTPKNRAFGKFVQQTKVTMLGVVPTLVATWQQSRCMEQLDWNSIKIFSSTGECSNPAAMRYLMALAGNKPVIEYCGGTEIGGAYLSSTVVQANYPACFSTPAMGTQILILNEDGKPANKGEVAIIPPAIGLSTSLLNADHQHIYFANMPTAPNGIPLRRHGDQIERLPNGYYCILGRVDDTMNLGGIKISAAEIERSLAGIANINETAAIAVQPQAGPSQLIIYAATHATLEETVVKNSMQHKINTQLNPLFKIHEVILVKELPKTASNKIIRRVLREWYLTSHS